MFSFATQKKLVALFNGRIVGYAQVAYTTPKESGSISSLSVTKGKPPGIDKLLLEAANNEIVKGGVRRIRTAVLVTKEELIETLTSLGFKRVLEMDAMVSEF